ncbi:glycosyltransferase family 25 protein [Aeromonas caviae]|uniref:glycosyltransferase family 25 protein n=1 Tax=Aeromonas caviae TaxID=648 RepID=UPI0009BBABD6|nr:glycosyltransferase family 25 protein [Aeromonas caviae]
MRNLKSIYILSVKGSPRQANFKTFPFKYSFFYAISLDQLDVFDDDASFNKYKRIVRNTEKSCTLSHISIAKDFLGKNHDWLIILEDDAVIVGDFEKLLSSLDNHKFNRPTALIIGHSKTDPRFSIVQRLKQPLYNPFYIGDFRFGKKEVNYIGTVSYILNYPAAQILAKMDRPYWVADDWIEIEKKGINVFHIEENIIYENLDGVSSTGNKVYIRHDIYKKPISNIMSIIYHQVKFFLKEKCHF